MTSTQLPLPPNHIDTNSVAVANSSNAYYSLLSLMSRAFKRLGFELFLGGILGSRTAIAGMFIGNDNVVAINYTTILMAIALR